MDHDISTGVWHLTKKDIFIIAFVSLGILTCSFFLYANFNQQLSIENTNPRIGTLIIRQNVAQRKLAKQVLWETAANELPLYNRDTIRTGALSSAFIRLNDKTEIDLGSKTLLVLDTLKKETKVNLSQGSVRLRRDITKGQGSVDQKIKIYSQGNVVNLKNADLQLKADPTRENFAVLVNRGQAGISTDGQKEESLGQAERFVLEKGESQRSKSLVSLKSPADGEYISTGQERPVISFAWEAKEQARVLRLEVSSDETFQRIAAQRPVRTSPLSLPLGEGTYYWRLALRDGQNKQRYTHSFKFRIFPPIQIKAWSSVQEEEDIATGNQPVSFSWDSIPNTGYYTLNVAKDQELTQSIKKFRLQKTSTTLLLPEGEYYWRISASNNLSGRQIQSKIYAFTIHKPKPLRAPVLHSPASEESIDTQNLAEKGFVFRWQADPQVRLAELVIAKEANFAKPILRKSSRTNKFPIQLGLKPGRYYWRVKGVQKKTPLSKTGTFLASGADLSQSNNDTAASTAYTPSVIAKTAIKKEPSTISIAQQRAAIANAFSSQDETLKEAPKVAKAVKITLLNPPQGSAFEQQDTQIEFHWREGQHKGELLFSIAEDQEFQKIVKTAKVQSSQWKLEGSERSELSNGLYFWRVQVIEDEKAFSASPVRQLRLVEKMKSIALVGGKSLRGVIANLGKKYATIATKKGSVRIRKNKLSGLKGIALLAPAEGAAFPKGDSTVLLRWTQTPLTGEFMLSIAQDEEFQKIVKTAKSQAPQFQLKRSEFENSLYFWKVEFRDGDKILSASPVRQLRLVEKMDSFPLASGKEIAGVAIDLRDGKRTIATRKGIIGIDKNAMTQTKITILEPPEGAAFARDDDTVLLRWEETSLPGNFVVTIAKDKGFGEIIKTYQTQGSQLELESSDLVEDSAYFWRVQLLGLENEEDILGQSPSRKFLMVEQFRSFELIDGKKIEGFILKIESKKIILATPKGIIEISKRKLAELIF